MGEEVEAAGWSTGEIKEDGVPNNETPSPPVRAKGADLTGIFKQMDVRESVVPAKGASDSVSGSSLRGGATDLFRTTDLGRTASDPGFTQIFQSLGQPLGPSPGKTSGAGGSLSRPSQEVNAQQASGGTAMPMESPQAPAASSAGDFTRMFARLDGSGAKGGGSFETPYQELQAATPTAQPQPLGGGFTQLLRTLSSECSAALPIGGALPAGEYVTQPVTEGPGEFTRIISRSALRDASQREVQKESQTPGEPEVQTSVPAPVPPASGQRALPPGKPLQNLASQRQAISSLVGAGSASPLQQIASGVSSTPVFPVAETQRGGRLQEYVPWLLISNLFAMLVLILLVSLLLVHHH